MELTVAYAVYAHTHISATTSYPGNASATSPVAGGVVKWLISTYSTVAAVNGKKNEDMGTV